MFDLPPELALEILAYLPLNSLATLPLVCRHWRNIFIIHASHIHHKAALLHGYIRSTAISIEDANKLYSQRSVGIVCGWRDLCRKRYCIEQSWSGRAPSAVTPHPSAGKFVHRIKVDEKAGYILTTSSVGGLSVTDLHGDQELWSLPDHHVRPYAHCEYGEGYVIFDYIDGSKEVWRRVDDCNEDEVASSVVPESQPGARQQRVSATAVEIYATATTKRGHFRPWAVLHPPQTTRAFRFSYPYLGAAAWDAVYLWDVRTGALVQAINQTQLGTNGEDVQGVLEVLGDINYIEVSDKYVFLCGIHSLRIFSRETGKAVLDIPSSKYPIASWHFSISPDRPAPGVQGSSLVLQKLVSRPVPLEESIIVNEFIAVHISTCGSHLAALMLSSKLIIIHNFEEAFKHGVPIRELSLEIQLGSPCHSSRYLTFENGRIGVATKTGVFVITSDWFEPSNRNNSRDTPPPPPRLSVFRVPDLADRSCLGAVSCLQMTDTGLFLNWEVDSLPDGHEERVAAMDETFYNSVSDEPTFASLANGVEVTLVDLHGSSLLSLSSRLVLH
ncbi:hypothetical protein D9615_007333 [Tricholomella constricta]|uniref:F-box domain-containing protein n=1 Tax=Tricholomella constricta TaxID=117010 RepID=A0A8H5H524_9AGAR|nr:hypothetical protein D9615_007333 [Tricholomella constricta]